MYSLEILEHRNNLNGCLGQTSTCFLCNNPANTSVTIYSEDRKRYARSKYCRNCAYIVVEKSVCYETFVRYYFGSSHFHGSTGSAFRCSYCNDNAVYSLYEPGGSTDKLKFVCDKPECIAFGELQIV